MTVTIKDVADGIVLVGLAKCTITPLGAIMFGTSMTAAFLGGAILIATILFGEFYFRPSDL